MCSFNWKNIKTLFIFLVKILLLGQNVSVKSFSGITIHKKYEVS